jgi:anaerobic magnesium-protoporphyrin IX monomethyl ester cyclase
VPARFRVLGGIHATFMYKQVLSEAPWVDVIVRGEGEEIFRRADARHRRGPLARGRKIKGLAYRRRRPRSSPPRPRPTVKDLDGSIPDWSLLEWEKYIYVPLNVRVAIPNMARGCPSPVRSARNGNSGATTACAIPKGGRRDREPGERPRRRLLHPRRRGTHHQPQEVHPVLRGADRPRPARQGQVGHQHPRHRHHARQGAAALLPQGGAGAHLARHRGGRAAEARPLQQGNQGRGEQGGHPPAARGRHLRPRRSSSWVSTTRRPRRWKKPTDGPDWQPDLANWAMYTPWPFTPLFQELGDKVEIFDFREVQFRHADHETRGDGPRDAA